MEKKKIKIINHDHTIGELDVWIDESFPFLAVGEYPGRHWIINHVPTGMWVAHGFPTKKSAIACARRLCTEWEWDEGSFGDQASEFDFPPGLKKEVAKAAKKHGGYR